jgi:alpha/beta superfamily hydrolase
MAKESHLNKFRAFYINHGFDVLTVKVNPLEVMLPSIGAQKAGHHLIDYLRDNVQKYPQIVVHGFSVGSYLFGEMLVALESRGHDKNQIKRHIKGLIFDSSIDMESVPHGYPRAILGDNIVTQMTEPIITTYLTVAYPIATRHYQASFRSLRQLDIKCPALLLYSQRDRVGSPQVNQRLITAWKSNGIPVYYKCWSDSLHVSHYYKYPEEYRQELNKFLETINL